MASLASLNAQNAKYASWSVRVVHPRVETYSFKAKGDAVTGKKFNCLLVSQDPQQYCAGLVKFQFKQRDAAERALLKFTEGSCWTLRTPVLDTQSQTRFLGASVKCTVLLDGQTRCDPVMVGTAVEKGLPRHVEPPLSLHDIRMIVDSQRVDFIAVVQDAEQPRTASVGGRSVQVATATFVDVKDGVTATASVSLWGRLASEVRGLVGSAVLVLNLNASREAGEIRLNGRDDSCCLVACKTERGEALLSSTQGVSQTPAVAVTATWTPSSRIMNMTGRLPICTMIRDECVTGSHGSRLFV